MTRVSLITTGGTIAYRRDERTGDAVAWVDGETLLASVRDGLTDIVVEIEEFCNISSSSLDLSTAFSLVSRINTRLASSHCDGVVITHGTDTMEESAYLADLLLTSDKPAVFTGAQRDAGQADTDGPRNIADAIRLAASPAARGLGAVICFDQDFHAARDVSKTHTSRTDTFKSWDHGKLGEVDGAVVSVQRRPLLRRSYAPATIETKVELIRLALGTGEGYLRHAADNGAAAIVIEGFGRGTAPPAVTRAVAETVARGIPVIVTSRCPQGRVTPVYDNGGSSDLHRAGAIFAGDLSGPKARILACVLLGLGLDMQGLKNEFAFLGG